MDPDANLGEQLQLAKRIANDSRKVRLEDDIARLAELVIALDGWLSNKGFLPKRWER